MVGFLYPLPNLLKHHLPRESPGNPQGTPSLPRYSTSGFQKAAQQTPVLGSGSWFFRGTSPENIPNLSKMNQNNIELCKTTGFWWVDRPEPLKNQNWLGPLPNLLKHHLPRESPGNPQGTPSLPRYSTSGFQKAAQQTPVLGSGSWFFREASPENIPNLSKMNQNNIELCKTTGFWWVDRPEPLKNQNWLGPLTNLLKHHLPRESPGNPQYSQV